MSNVFGVYEAALPEGEGRACGAHACGAHACGAHACGARPDGREVRRPYVSNVFGVYGGWLARPMCPMCLVYALAAL